MCIVAVVERLEKPDRETEGKTETCSVYKDLAT
jgi:hypothetical protein